MPCPLGTFRETGFGSSINSCYQCPPYKACTSTGNKELEKNLPYCEAGYYCIYGSPATQPSKDDETYDPNKAGPCPAGFYCETQQILTPCPRGSLGTNEMQRSATDCAKCPAGMHRTCSLHLAVFNQWVSRLLKFFLPNMLSYL